MKALLHYLWDQAGLTNFPPEEPGGLNWKIVADKLRGAAANTKVGSWDFSSLLFVPDGDVGDSARLLQLRNERSLEADTKGKRAPLLLFVALYESHESYPDVEGIPDVRVQFAQSIYVNVARPATKNRSSDRINLFERRLQKELDLKSGPANLKIVLLGTLGIRTSILPGQVESQNSIIDCVGMLVDSNWLPVEDLEHKKFQDYLLNGRSWFRVNLSFNEPDRGIRPACVIFTNKEILGYIGWPPDSVLKYLKEQPQDVWIWNRDEGREGPPLFLV
jgi:hypothetical protein